MDRPLREEKNLFAGYLHQPWRLIFSIRDQPPSEGPAAMRRIHILHENAAWLPPLAQAFDQRRLPWTEWFLDAGTFDLSAPPPDGVFYNRMSASSQDRKSTRLNSSHVEI